VRLLFMIEKIPYDTMKVAYSFLSPQNFFLPYLTSNQNLISYMALPCVFAAKGVKSGVKRPYCSFEVYSTDPYCPFEVCSLDHYCSFQMCSVDPYYSFQVCSTDPYCPFKMRSTDPSHFSPICPSPPAIPRRNLRSIRGLRGTAPLLGVFFKKELKK
jgi:hypothetical protein